MRIIHTADWHLGRTLHAMPLETYHARFLDHFVDLVDEEKPDAVIVAGDVFDRAVASTSAIAMCEDAFARLVDRTRLIVIPGNHDSAQRLGFGAQFHRDGLHVVWDERDCGRAIDLDGVRIYPIPYLEPDRARYLLASPDHATVEDDATDVSESALPRSHEAVMAAAMRRVDDDLAAHPRDLAIAVVHAFVTGSTTSDSERDISVGGAQQIPGTVFAHLGHQRRDDRRSHGVSYVACGHLHRPQTPYRDDEVSVRYSGSVMPLSFSEASDSKSSTIIDIEGRQLTTREIPTESGLDLRVIAGTLDELTSAPPAWAPSAFVQVSVTDALRPERMVERIRRTYPHALVIRHTAAETDAAQPRRDVTALSRIEATTAFFTQSLDRELTTDERRIIDDVWTTLRRGEEQ